MGSSIIVLALKVFDSGLVYLLVILCENFILFFLILKGFCLSVSHSPRGGQRVKVPVLHVCLCFVG